MNKALASFPLPGPKPKVKLSPSSSRRAARARTGRFATQLEALANAHKSRS